MITTNVGIIKLPEQVSTTYAEGGKMTGTLNF